MASVASVGSEELALRRVRGDLPPAAEVETLRYVHPAALGASFAQRPGAPGLVKPLLVGFFHFFLEDHG